jgi:tRNA-Thr(GGU) m(6)t(6)A37 methyltransferase TsaA
MEIKMSPVAWVSNHRSGIQDDNWGNVISEITLSEEYSEESIAGINDFSHIEVVYFFDRVDDSEVITKARHPRDNPSWPLVGIFAQRGKNRPNRLGVCIVELLKAEGKTLTVKGLDAIDGTPVLDIKPVIKEFLPKKITTQPEWASELMKAYW